MNTTNILKTGLLIMLLTLTIKSHSQQQAILGVLNLKTNGVLFDNEQAGDLLRLETEKLGKYEVLQREDARIVLTRAGIKFDSCYSKESLIQAGKLMKAEYMLSGYVSKFGEKIVIRLMLINVNGSFVEKSNVMEYLNIQDELQTMLRISVKKLIGEHEDEAVVSALTLKSFDNKINNPGISKLTLTGPRFGAVYLTGEDERRLRAKESTGGYGLDRSFMFVFGYQKEVQYINEGNFQALLEFVPLISGLDQGRLVPSITVMNGFRNNKTGWEIAFGPSISITRTALGFYDAQDNWHLAIDANNPLIPKKPDHVLVYALDKRGDADFQFSFVLAGGKTIRSGSMNLPLNVYATVSKNNYRFGVTFGFNSKTKSTKSSDL